MQVKQGSRIEIEVNGVRQSWLIVGSREGNLEEGRVSFNAPLIQMIIGARAGDKVNGKILDREVVIKILKVD